MPDGTNRGVVDIQEAQHLARTMNLDLIEVAPNVDPPVCRIFDFGKFNFEREKKERDAKKAQKSIELKGIRLKPKTSDHHLGFKVRAARRFLEAGNKVKVTLRFRGREDRIPHVAYRMMDRVKTETADLAQIEQNPMMEGKTMLMVMAPTAATIAAAANRATQQRLAQEAAEDRRKGYLEEEEADDETEADGADDAFDEEVEAPATPVAAEVPAVEPEIDFRDKDARRKLTLQKRSKQRTDEIFGLP